MTGQRTAIVGLGVTGLSCVKFLHGRDDLLVLDTRAAPPLLARLEQEYPDVAVCCGVREHSFAGVDRIVVSPGVSLESCLLAKARGRVPIVGDIDLFCDAANAPVIGITGTNGKSTVTSLVGHLLAVAGRISPVGGNLGDAALDILNPDADVYVLELSSFQLERMLPHHFEAATILNVSEDHLDRHGDMDGYVSSKRRIYRDCGLAVTSREDAATRPSNPVPDTVTFGADEPEGRNWGVRVSGGQRWLAGNGELLLEAHHLPIAGSHNELNALAACALLANSGVAGELLAQGLLSFAGLPHRGQKVLQANGVTYVNDSKATNVGATLAALEGFGDRDERKLVLIAGGDGKGADFTALRAAVRRYVKAVVVFGRDAGKIEAALRDVVDVSEVADMAAAVVRAQRVSVAGDVVLLSPACASLDMYADFAARGDDFALRVRELAA
jgi:UDP-N-acetylmuramoylalanine--D-glutamate ligase